MNQRLINIIAHVAGWGLLLILVLGFAYRAPGGSNWMHSVFSWPFVLFAAVYISLFYLNIHVLIPAFYLRRRFLLYFSIILLLLAGVSILRPFDRLMKRFPRVDRVENNFNAPPGMRQGFRSAFPPSDSTEPRFFAEPPQRMTGDSNRLFPMPPDGHRRRGQADIVSIILFITVWSLSTALCIISQWRKTEKRAMQAEAEKATAELSFLKAQINPHFLFNTLNNIYSLAITKSEHTAESIMKLSNIMRYVTDDIREDYVLLGHELECMRDYIDLQRLRLGRKMNVEFSVTGDVGEKKIAPLVLMTFIENVFKYGISNHEPSTIRIRLAVETHSITFFCQNKLYEHQRLVERTGIGIANTRQRLEHLYKGRYFLDINTDGGLYTVQLTLQA